MVPSFAWELTCSRFKGGDICVDDPLDDSGNKKLKQTYKKLAAVCACHRNLLPPESTLTG